MDRKHQAQLQKQEINKIKKKKYAITRTIANTMNERVGGISTVGAEKTFEIDQNLIGESVNLNTSKKIFELDLDEHGPYKIGDVKTLPWVKEDLHCVMCMQFMIGHLETVQSE